MTPINYTEDQLAKARRIVASAKGRAGTGKSKARDSEKMRKAGRKGAKARWKGHIKKSK